MNDAPLAPAIVVNGNALSYVTGTGHPRVNADFPETNRNDTASPSRISDHDPVIAFFTFFPVPVTTGVAVTPSTQQYSDRVSFTAPLQAGGKTDKTFSECCGKALKVIEPDGRIINYEYDKRGNTTRIWDNRGQNVRYEYDARWNKVTKVITAHGATAYTYDPSGQLILGRDSSGDEVRLDVTGPCARCVMTTLPQADLPRDPGILRAAAQHNHANVGVYAAVARGGTIRRGDPVRLE